MAVVFFFQNAYLTFTLKYLETKISVSNNRGFYNTCNAYPDSMVTLSQHWHTGWSSVDNHHWPNSFLAGGQSNIGKCVVKIL